ncbi:MAG TPA: hypothetical protein VFQ68_10610 [Streptosporangiaceae bacterium]|nr:hypothetical protein [Streptosporangiaceae bacterium]
MSDEVLTVPPRAGDLGSEDVTLEAELAGKDAEREIDKAVKGRRGIARKYVKWVRRRNPGATPAEIITMLEHHYVTAISVAGAAITAGSIAGEIGIAMIPGVGAAAAGAKAAAKEAGKKATREAAKAAARQTAKAAAKSAARGAAKSGAQRAAARLLPAGASQLQFEITALFALAVADIHGTDYDQQQAHALVYGLCNGRVSQKQIAAMASDLTQSANPEIVSASQPIAGGRKDLGHWASTLADSLPGEAAQSLVRVVQTGVLDDIRGGLDRRQQAAVDYGAGALAGGITRFVFGREVVDAAQSAFPDPPGAFPAYLDVPAKPEKADSEPNRALEALEDAAKAAGAGVSTGAVAVGTGVANAAHVVTRPFRSVDLDGDGVPDQPQALTAVKGVGGAIAGAVGDGVSGLFKPKKRGKHAAGGPQREPEAEDDEDATGK